VRPWQWLGGSGTAGEPRTTALNGATLAPIGGNNGVDPGMSEIGTGAQGLLIASNDSYLTHLAGPDDPSQLAALPNGFLRAVTPRHCGQCLARRLAQLSLSSIPSVCELRTLSACETLKMRACLYNADAHRATTIAGCT
jgi:hypothetical protein